MSLPLPDFYDPKQVSQLYMERAGLVTEAGEAFAAKHSVTVLVFITANS